MRLVRPWREAPCAWRGLAVLIWLWAVALAEETLEFSGAGTTIAITIREESQVSVEGVGTWIITLSPPCTNADLAKLGEDMPPGTIAEFKGDPDHGGLCVFMMHGSLEQLQQELASHSFSSTPVVEADSHWRIVPHFSFNDDAPVQARGLQSQSQSDPPWGLDRIDERSGLDQDFSQLFTGAGVHIYVADTGIRTTHDDFEGRGVPTLEHHLGQLTVCSPTDTSCAADRDGHGTACAGIVGGKAHGVAKGATLHAVKILGDDGSGSFGWFISALDWVLTTGPKPAVWSASLGGPGTSLAVTLSINSAVQGGVVVVVAAGNEGETSDPDACSYQPANVASAITVASTTQGDVRSSFSNVGSCVDIFAPGSQVLSATNVSDSATTYWWGTSMACPHVSGVAAMILEFDGSLSAGEVTALILSSATEGAISDVNGTVNKLLYSAFYNITSTTTSTSSSSASTTSTSTSSASTTSTSTSSASTTTTSSSTFSSTTATVTRTTTTSSSTTSATSTRSTTSATSTTTSVTSTAAVVETSSSSTSSLASLLALLALALARTCE